MEWHYHLEAVACVRWRRTTRFHPLRHRHDRNIRVDPNHPLQGADHCVDSTKVATMIADVEIRWDRRTCPSTKDSTDLARWWNLPAGDMVVGGDFDHD